MLHQTLIEIEGHPNLARDIYSGAIVNKNKNEYEAAKKQRTYYKEMWSKLSDTQKEIQILKQQMEEMKRFVMAKYSICQ